MLERTVGDDELAVTEARAASMIGWTVRRLRAWAARDLIRPSSSRSFGPRTTVRLYDFGALVELHVAKALLDGGRSPQQIRRVVTSREARPALRPGGRTCRHRTVRSSTE